MKELSKFRIEGKCPSYNMSFKINHNTKSVYLTKTAHDFKRNVKMNTPRFKVNQDGFLLIHIQVMQNWYYKNGNLKKQDVQNMDKLYIDALCDGIGIDDSHVQSSNVEKIQYMGDPFSLVTIYSTDILPEYKGE